MNPFDAIILGIVEGLTEFLPVSSTGHMILMGHALGLDSPAQKEYVDAFEVVIQLGALLAVAVYYRALIGRRIAGALRRDPASLRLLAAIAIAFAPAAALGFVLHKWIERVLFGPKPVAAALIVGGLLMIGVEAWRKFAKPPQADGLEHVTPMRALAIGLAQVASLWPGTSRSMSTIVGAQLTGLSTATAAEFSFLLALPTLGAATLFKLVHSRHVLLGQPGGTLSLAIGMVVSFVVALAVIAAFLRYLRNAGLAPFGWYRVLAGIAVLLLIRS